MEKHFNDKEIFAIDPHGALPLIMPLAPEEVQLIAYDDSKFGAWASYHLVKEYKDGTASGAQKNAVLHIEHQTLDSTIEETAAGTRFRTKGVAIITQSPARTGIPTAPICPWGSTQL